MKHDIYTLSQLIKNRVEALKSLPPKAKDAYATAEQVTQFNELRQHVVDSVTSQGGLIPSPLAIPRAGFAGYAKYADVLTKYSDLLTITEANDTGLGGPTVG